MGVAAPLEIKNKYLETYERNGPLVISINVGEYANNYVNPKDFTSGEINDLEFQAHLSESLNLLEKI
jgi:hypothetical protein